MGYGTTPAASARGEGAGERSLAGAPVPGAHLDRDLAARDHVADVDLVAVDVRSAVEGVSRPCAVDGVRTGATEDLAGYGNGPPPARFLVVIRSLPAPPSRVAAVASFDADAVDTAAAVLPAVAGPPAPQDA